MANFIAYPTNYTIILNKPVVIKNNNYLNVSDVNAYKSVYNNLCM